MDLQNSMNSGKSKVFDFLRDEHFVKWVQNPTDESNHYWTRWISNHNDVVKDIEMARRIIQSGSLIRNKAISEVEYDKMLENIMVHARKKSTRSSSFTMYLAIAASILLLIISSLVLYNVKTETSNEVGEIALTSKYSPPGQKITTRLPDGTIVRLNSDSKIIFPEKFNSEIREVTLVGEAFFDVERDEDHPFVIRTEMIDIIVLGTSFNVKAFDDNLPEVAVKTGHVLVKDILNNQVDLMPTEMVRKDGTDLIKTLIQNSYDPFAWTNHRLVFNDESLEEVLKKVSRWYGITIDKRSGKYSEKKVTGDYNNPTINELMDVLTFVYNFKYSYNEQEKKLIIQ